MLSIDKKKLIKTMMNVKFGCCPDYNSCNKDGVRFYDYIYICYHEDLKKKVKEIISIFSHPLCTLKAKQNTRGKTNTSDKQV